MKNSLNRLEVSMSSCADKQMYLKKPPLTLQMYRLLTGKVSSLLLSDTDIAVSGTDPGFVEEYST